MPKYVPPEPCASTVPPAMRAYAVRLRNARQVAIVVEHAIRIELVQPGDVDLLCAVEARAREEMQVVQREGMQRQY